MSEHAAGSWRNWLSQATLSECWCSASLAERAGTCFLGPRLLADQVKIPACGHPQGGLLQSARNLSRSTWGRRAGRCGSTPGRARPCREAWRALPNGPSSLREDAGEPDSWSSLSYEIPCGECSVRHHRGLGVYTLTSGAEARRESPAAEESCTGQIFKLMNIQQQLMVRKNVCIFWCLCTSGVPLHREPASFKQKPRGLCAGHTACSRVREAAVGRVPWPKADVRFVSISSKLVGRTIPGIAAKSRSGVCIASVVTLALLLCLSQQLSG